MKRWPIPNLKKSDEYHGVYYDSDLPEPKRWVAQVDISCGRFAYVGNFKTELEAAKAYNDYVKKYKHLNIYPFFDIVLNDLENKDR